MTNFALAIRIHQVFNFLSGVTYALKFVHAQFLELMEEWYGHNGPYDDERMEMTRLFEERIGADDFDDQAKSENS